MAYQLGPECLLATQRGSVNSEPYWMTRSVEKIDIGRYFIGSGIEAWPTAGDDRDITFSNECHPDGQELSGLTRTVKSLRDNTNYS